MSEREGGGGWIPHVHLRVVNCMRKRSCALPLVVCKQKQVIIVSTGGRNELRGHIRAYHKLINRMCSKIFSGTEQEFFYNSECFAVCIIAYPSLKKFSKYKITKIDVFKRLTNSYRCVDLSIRKMAMFDYISNRRK